MKPETESPKSSLLVRAGRAIRLAFAFLTVVPLGKRGGESTDTELAASRFAYPLVGGAIGLSLALLSELLDRSGSPLALSAFLILLAWVAISGGLHLDGVADTFDGLFLWGDAERRLTVMRDPHVGSFGVVALVLVLLGKFAALSALSGRGRAWAILGAAIVGRALILVSAGSANYARSEGTGRILIDATTLRDAIGASALVLAVGGIVAGRSGFLAGIAALIVAGAMTRLSVHKLGGVTGDTLGALVELGESLFLVTLGLSQSR